MTTRIACLGDSLTRAQLSVDYLDLLQQHRPPGDVQLARFGVNGDFAHNLAQRLDAVVADPPDVITVLIGTNDARASLPGYPVERAMKRKQLPERPSAGWFQQCLGAVVERLRTQTDATIALLSLPVLGQQLDGAAAQASRAYSRMIAEVATTNKATYLPLHERQTEELRQANPPPIPYRNPTPAASVSIVARRALLRHSLDTISRRRGLVLTTDHIHQNSRGAALVAEVIDTWLPTRTTQPACKNPSDSRPVPRLSGSHAKQAGNNEPDHPERSRPPSQNHHTPTQPDQQDMAR